MRLLVTGSSGQLGREICQQLKGHHDVVGVDLVPGPHTQHLGSVADRALVYELAKGADVIIHAASLHVPDLKHRKRHEFVDVNVQGTLNVLEAAVREKVSRVVYTSTTSVYGLALELPDRAAWVTEEVAPRPRDVYDVTKLAAEELCRVFAREDALAVTCLRTSRFYKQSPEVIAWYRLFRGGDLRDIARAHVLAAHQAQTGFELFNISGPTPFKREDAEALHKDVRAVLRRRVPGFIEEFERRGWKLPARIDRVYSSARAAEHLGYHPKLDWRDALAQSDHAGPFDDPHAE